MRRPPLLVGLFVAACTTAPPPTTLSHDDLLDPKICQDCHPDHYREWSGSMHAYAGEDPVFVAMNQRGQRETNGALGDFCVKCHAPMALRMGLTKDGLNLAEVPAKVRGVTCFFCHTVTEVKGTHDNPLVLATDDVLRAGIADPQETVAHRSAYSPLHDRERLESSGMCGSCHDIVTPGGAQLERTFAEWRASVFSQAPGGATCNQCHMAQSRELRAASNLAGAPLRRTHAHTFEGVDVALTPFPEAAEQRRLVQESLDSTIQTAVCVEQLGAASRILVMMDNAGAGHGWPSGALQDRRAWVEVVAKRGDEVIYESGTVPSKGSPTRLEDPDLWLLRDCMYGADGKPVSMFWQAVAAHGSALPTQATFDTTDPRHTITHLARTYPGPGRPLAMEPDRVQVRVRLQPIDRAVLEELVDSGDLDAAVVDAMPEFVVGREGVLEWTPQAVTDSFADPRTGSVYTCVTKTSYNVRALTAPATSAASCEP